MQSNSQVKLEADRPVVTFSKVKFRLQNLLAELNRLRDQELSTRSELRKLLEKQNLLDANHAKEQRIFQTELSAATDSRKKLEELVNNLRSNLTAAEVREQTYKRELNGLLHSRSSVTEQLKVDNSQLQLRLQERSKELADALDKLRRQGGLIESAENEFIALKRSVHEAHRIVQEREEHLTRLQAKLESTTSLDNKLLDRVRVLQKRLDDGLKIQLAKDLAIQKLEQKLELHRRDHHLKEQLSLAQTMLEVKESTNSRLSSKVQMLETQVRAMGILELKSQERLKQQEDLLESTRRNLSEAQDTINSLHDSLETARNNVTSYAEACKKLVLSTSEELRRSAKLQVQLENIIKSNNVLQNRQMKFSVVHIDLTSLSKYTSTSDLIQTRDQSTCTLDVQGEVQFVDQFVGKGISNSSSQEPLYLLKSIGMKVSHTSEQFKTKKSKMKSKRQEIKDLTIRNQHTSYRCDASVSTEKMADACTNDQLNLGDANGPASDNQESKKNLLKVQQEGHQKAIELEGSYVQVTEATPRRTSEERDPVSSEERHSNGTTAPLSQEQLAASGSVSFPSDRTSRTKKEPESEIRTDFVSRKSSPASTSSTLKYTGQYCNTRMMTESEAYCGRGSCVSTIHHSQSRAPSPDLEFDVEMLLKQDLFPDLDMSGHENVEWVYTDTEAGVTFTEHSRDPTIPADFTADSCPDSQEMTTTKRRRSTANDNT